MDSSEWKLNLNETLNSNAKYANMSFGLVSKENSSFENSMNSSKILNTKDTPETIKNLSLELDSIKKENFGLKLRIQAYEEDRQKRMLLLNENSENFSEYEYLYTKLLEEETKNENLNTELNERTALLMSANNVIERLEAKNESVVSEYDSRYEKTKYEFEERLNNAITERDEYKHASISLADELDSISNNLKESQIENENLLASTNLKIEELSNSLMEKERFIKETRPRLDKIEKLENVNDKLIADSKSLNLRIESLKEELKLKSQEDDNELRGNLINHRLLLNSISEYFNLNCILNSQNLEEFSTAIEKRISESKKFDRNKNNRILTLKKNYTEIESLLYSSIDSFDLKFNSLNKKFNSLAKEYKVLLTSSKRAQKKLKMFADEKDSYRRNSMATSNSVSNKHGAEIRALERKYESLYKEYNVAIKQMKRMEKDAGTIWHHKDLLNTKTVKETSSLGKSDLIKKIALLEENNKYLILEIEEKRESVRRSADRENLLLNKLRDTQKNFNRNHSKSKSRSKKEVDSRERYALAHRDHNIRNNRI